MSANKLAGLIVTLCVLLIIGGAFVAIKLAQKNHQDSATDSSVIRDAAAKPANVIATQVTVKPNPTAAASVSATAATVNPAPQTSNGDPKFSSFRGVHWGASLKSMPDMSLSDEQEDTVEFNLDENTQLRIKNLNTREWVRHSDTLSFGEVPVDAIEYDTFDDKFYKVYVICTSSFTDMVTVFTSYYGKPTESIGTLSYKWEGTATDGSKVSISLFAKTNSTPYVAMAVITNETLADQLHAVQLKQAQAQLHQTKSDF